MSELLERSLRGDVHVAMNLPDKLWTVEVDPGELELAILNLCVNARDAMPSGGVIEIDAKNVTPSRGPVTGKAVRLTVRDPGVGMGLRFDRVNDDEQALINEFVEAHFFRSRKI